MRDTGEIIVVFKTPRPNLEVEFATKHLITASDLYIITLEIIFRLIRSKRYRFCVVLVRSRDFGSHRRLLD